MQYAVTFHVEEDTLQDAEAWRDKAKAILDANRELLVSRSTQQGSYCSGHAEIAQNQPSVNNNPPSNLQLGPRE